MTAPLSEDFPRLVDDRYEIGEQIGHGGTSFVYRAHDTKSGRTVALKVLRADIVPPDIRTRFAREIAFTVGMQHPGILEVLDAGEVNGRPYYVMPLVAGLTLQHRLTGGVQLPVPEAVEIAAKIADALAYAHSRSVIHRDIKPANILLDGDRPVLADFGIARALDGTTTDRLTESGLALGTALYMSPEQANQTADERSDVYSLGCVLYEMLIGQPPFTGVSVQQVLARHASSAVPSLRDVRGTISVALEQVVHRALAKTPADRYASAEEFAAALRGVDARPSYGVTTAQPPRARIALVATAAVALAGVAMFALMRQHAAALDQSRVLVLPLAGRGADSTGAPAGEDAATIIGAAIEGVGPLRWVDGWSLVSEAQRRDMSTVSANATDSIARHAGAGFALSGHVSPRQDSVDVVLELRDATADSVVANGKGSALAGETWRAALRAVNAVLPRLTKSGVTDVGAAWQARSPKAVAAYLRGEGAYRRLQMTAALAAFREALGEDSLLTFAALRGAQAASWSHRPREAGELARFALRHPLPARDAHFARGLAAFVEGNADSSARELRRAIDIDSTMTVAWIQLGDTFTHLLPHDGDVDSAAGATLERALALDPAAAPTAYHLAERGARAGDSARVTALLGVVRRGDADTVAVRQIELMQRCAAARGRTIDWSADARAHPQPLLFAAAKLAAGGSQMACAAGAFAAILSIDTAATSDADGRRFAALVGTVGVHHAQGQAAQATAVIDSFVTRWGSGNSLLLRQALVDSSTADRARAVARTDSARLGADFSRSPFSNRLWLLGVWSARDGHLPAARGAARELGRRADSTHSAINRRYAQSVLAHVAVAERDTARALALLAPLIGAGIPADELQWDESASMADERLLLAQLLLARHDGAGALGVASVFDSSQPEIYLLYLRPSLKLRMRAAESLGDDRLVARFKARLAALRGGSGPVP